MLLFSGFKPAIDTCSYDWDQTEITLCSHIVGVKSKPEKKALQTAESSSYATEAVTSPRNVVGYAFLVSLRFKYCILHIVDGLSMFKVMFGISRF